MSRWISLDLAGSRWARCTWYWGKGDWDIFGIVAKLSGHVRPCIEPCWEFGNQLHQHPSHPSHPMHCAKLFKCLQVQPRENGECLMRPPVADELLESSKIGIARVAHFPEQRPNTSDLDVLKY